MTSTIYRYEFKEEVALEEVEATLVLAIMAAESLHGAARVRLELRHRFESQSRTCVIDASTPVGCDFYRLFAGFLLREFSPRAFRVKRVHKDRPLSKSA